MFIQKKQNSIETTIDNILMSETYTLEQYRSIEDKKMLLKHALATEDGNAILTVRNLQLN